MKFNPRGTSLILDTPGLVGEKGRNFRLNYIGLLEKKNLTWKFQNKNRKTKKIFLQNVKNSAVKNDGEIDKQSKSKKRRKKTIYVKVIKKNPKQKLFNKSQFNGTAYKYEPVRYSSVKKRLKKALLLTQNREKQNTFLTTKKKKRIKRKKNSKNKKRGRRPSKEDMVYTHESPNYCLPASHWNGTKGRWCSDGGVVSGVRGMASVKSGGGNIGGVGTGGEDTKSEDGTEVESSCGNLCCGRGFEVVEEEKVENCRCQFVWCCEVVCEKCRSVQHVNKCL